MIDQYFGLTFDTETKCVESEEEPASISKEHFLQFNCYIDKDVKYLASGLKNVRAFNKTSLKFQIEKVFFSARHFQRLQESLEKKSPTLDRDAQYVKKLKVSRLPGYMTVQMVRFQFKQKDAVNAKILKDIKFPQMLDTFELCSEELQQKLVPMRKKFKVRTSHILRKKLKQNLNKLFTFFLSL